MTNQSKIWQDNFIKQQKSKANLIKQNGGKVMETGIQTNKINIYAIKDKDMGIINIFQLPNDAIAKRSFAVEVNKEGTPFNNWPDKFELVNLGRVDETTGEVIGPASCIATASELITAKN